MTRRGRAHAALLLQALLLTCAIDIQSTTPMDYGIPIEIKLWDSGRTPLAHMVDVTNAFGLKVLAEHNFLNENNIAFSPYGLMGILVALYEGVDGEASFQLQRAIGLPWNRNTMRVGFRDIHRTLKTYFVPEEGFLAGLALNNENVTFNESYKKILRFYGYDLDSDKIPTLPTATQASANASATPDAMTTAGTTTAMPTTQEMSAKEEPSTVMVAAVTEPTTTGAATTVPEITTVASAEIVNDVVSSTTITMSTTESTTSASSVDTTTTTEQNVAETTSEAQQVATTTPTTTVAAVAVPSTTTLTTTDVTAPVTTLQTTSEVTSSVTTTVATPEETATTVATTTAGTDGQTINNEVDILSTPNTVSTSGDMATMVTNDITSSEISSTETSGTSTDSTSDNPSTIETLERRKKSIVDFIFTNPSYLDDYYFYKSYEIPIPDIPTGGGGFSGESGDMFLVNGLRNIQVTYMSYDAILDYAYLPHLEASALRLPLDSERYYLLAVLPATRSPAELGRLLARMARTSDLRDVTAALRPNRVRALVPSFMVKGHVTLTTDLQKLGIREVFEPRQRDFTPMTHQGGVYVRSIEQAVSVAIRKYRADEPKTNKFTMNRLPVKFLATYPFLYFVMDSTIHVALMAGKMVDPLNNRIL